jgi:hypothetical protein
LFGVVRGQNYGWKIRRKFLTPPQSSDVAQRDHSTTRFDPMQRPASLTLLAGKCPSSSLALTNHVYIHPEDERVLSAGAGNAGYALIKGFVYTFKYVLPPSTLHNPPLIQILLS